MQHSPCQAIPEREWIGWPTSHQRLLGVAGEDMMGSQRGIFKVRSLTAAIVRVDDAVLARHAGLTTATSEKAAQQKPAGSALQLTATCKSQKDAETKFYLKLFLARYPPPFRCAVLPNVWFGLGFITPRSHQRMEVTQAITISNANPSTVVKAGSLRPHSTHQLLSGQLSVDSIATVQLCPTTAASDNTQSSGERL